MRSKPNMINKERGWQTYYQCFPSLNSLGDRNKVSTVDWKKIHSENCHKTTKAREGDCYVQELKMHKFPPKISSYIPFKIKNYLWMEWFSEFG